MNDLKKIISEWDRHSKLKLSTDLSVLTINDCLNGKSQFAYNGTVDTVFIDVDSLNEIPNLLQRLNDLSLDEYLYRLTPYVGESSLTKSSWLIYPFSQKQIRNFKNIEELKKYIINNDIWKSKLKTKGAGVFFSSYMIDIQETFAGMDPLDIIKLLFHVACGTIFQPPENLKKNKKIYTVKSFESSPLFFFLTKIKHRYVDTQLQTVLVEGKDFSQLFEEKYLKCKLTRNSFTDFMYKLQQQAKSLFTLINILTPNRIIFHLPWSSYNSIMRPEPQKMYWEKHQLYPIVEKFLNTDEAKGIDKNAREKLRKIYRFPINVLSELSKEFFLTIFENIRESNEYNTSTGLGYKIFQQFFEYSQFNFPQEYLDPAALKRLANSKINKKSPELYWVKGKISEDIRGIISSWLKEKTNIQIADRINVFLEYLILLENNDVRVEKLENLRPSMFYDVLKKESTISLYDYIKDSKASTQTQSTTWSSIHNCLRWCFNKLSLENEYEITCPMPPSRDVFNIKSGQRLQTSRRAMPSNFYDVLLDVATEEDYKNSKSPQRVKLLNANTGKIDSIYFKNIARIVHLLLLIPIRLHQARWLDEGLLDDKIYDYESRKYLQNKNELVNFRYNDGQTHSQKFGRTGLLKADSEDDITELNLFINTNKTAPKTLQKKGTFGYELAWPAETNIKNVDMVYEIILEQIEFNRKYASSKKLLTPVRVVDEEAGKYNRGMWDDMPCYIPLFRDPRRSRLSNRISIDKNYSSQPLYLPTSAESVRELFYKLLVIADERYKERFPDYKNHSVAFDVDGNRIFDVHTLRVYGITSLLEKGLSPETVQVLVGHATTIMTLYYKKLMAEEYKRQLLVAKAKGGAARLNTKKFLSSDGEELIAIFDVATDFEGIDDKFHPKNYIHGMPLTLNGGVCFGFNCDDGRIAINLTQKGETISVEANEYQRCGLCRFFKSGPQFLLEQIYFYNLVSVNIVEAISRRDQLIQDSQDVYNSSSVNSAELASHQIQYKIDDLNLELAKLIQERERRGQLLEASLDKAKLNGNTNNVLPALMTDKQIRVEDVQSLELQSEFERCMEISTQGMILGIDGEEETLPMRKLKTLYNKLSDITKNSNALLYMPDDDVKRVALLYKLQHLTEIMGRTFSNEEFENPRILFQNLALDTSEKISLALKELSVENANKLDINLEKAR